MKKAVITAVALTLVLCLAVGGTLAYLTMKTDPIVNTFTFGNVSLTLEESKDLDLKMIPGKVITKDPKVTVGATSEDCWLLVKIEKSANFDQFFEAYVVADDWTELTAGSGIFWRAATAGDSFPVLKNNQVKVLESVNKAQMDALENGAAKPTLTFTAYAVQKENVADAAKAWDLVK